MPKKVRTQAKSPTTQSHDAQADKERSALARALLESLHGSHDDITPEQEAIMAEVRAERGGPPPEGYKAWAKRRRYPAAPAARKRTFKRTALGGERTFRSMGSGSARSV